MRQTFLEHIFQGRGLQRDFAPDKTCSGRLRQRTGVKGRLVITVWRGGGKAIMAGSRFNLATRHPVNFVVQHHAGEVEVAPTGVDKVIATNCQAVTIASDDYDLQVRTSQFQAGRKGQGPAVGNMESVGVNISAEPPGAANSANEGQLVLRNPEFIDSPEQRSQRYAMPATRAQKMREQVFPQIIADIELAVCFTHGMPVD